MDPDLQMKPSDFFSLTFQEQVEYISKKIIWGEPLSHLWVSKIWSFWAFHPILASSFLVVFGDEVTKILPYNLFLFHFVLTILPWKRKTSYRKSCNLSDEKPKTKLPKYVMSQAFMFFGKSLVNNVCFWSTPGYL